MQQRICKDCGEPFVIITKGENNRKYCSKICSKRAYAKQLNMAASQTPEMMKVYNANRKAKRPTEAKEKHRSDRLKIIELLGSGCVVCGASNPFWLHIDYIPTTRGAQFRHPRHIKYISEHISQFRLLCANHHYELTLTGKIEGTEITQ